jgi:tricorn protease
MKFVYLLLVLILITALNAQNETGLLRFPAIHGNQLVFTYAGDLYTVPATGGVARKLTSHEGFEMFARFSPDGKNIAFTGQYDGNTEVYLIPAEGGVPQRLTFTATLGRDDVSDRMGPNNIVMTWKNDNQSIVFRSRMYSYNDFNGALFTVAKDGGLVQQLPLPRGGFCSFSPDDKKMAYNRIFREFRTWKRYRGGMTDDIWIYDFETKKVENITNNPASDIIPLWQGNKIYFLSDRDENKRMNLYVYDLSNRQTRVLTSFKDYDIKFPSLGDQAIVFENGGYIYRFDLATEQTAKIPVSLREDLSTGRSAIVPVADKVSNYEISPDGKRALFGARGDIFTVPVKTGVTRNITTSPAVHERNSKWSPDGKWIAFISDASGEDQIYVQAQDGKTPARQISKSNETYLYQIRWSPDSKKILWADKRLRLRYIDISTAAISEVDQAQAWEFSNYNWSPDNKWIVYAKPELEVMNRIYIYSLETKKSLPVTEGWYSSANPIFSSDGKYIFFTSDRDFKPVFSQTEYNHAYLDMSRIYLLTLAKDIESPFKLKSDEVELTKAESKTADDKKDEAKDKAIKETVVKIEFDGIIARIADLPIQSAEYDNLGSAGDALYYIRRSSKDEKSQLILYDLKEQKESELGQFNGYEISADLKKMLVGADNKYSIIDLPKSKIEIKESLNLSAMEIQLDRKKEWQQIFKESWRQMREFYYAPNMQGVDWTAVYNKYEPLVNYVNHRADLTYLIGEMIGELSTGHTYVGGGDKPEPTKIKTGLLGAVLRRDTATGYYQIEKILPGQNWDKALRSPLTAIGVNTRAGDYIISINGQATNTLINIYSALINTAGKQVTLSLNSAPKTEGAREVLIEPIADESELYYYDWVQSNIEKVNLATAGKVGYIHIPDMGVSGLNEFVKHYYPQLRKKALIIDVRGNGGGSVSAMIIERLRREIVMFEFARNTAPGTDPGGMLYGPQVMLADEFSASDGDIVTYRFKQYKLGQVIGKRTWGGVVGIRETLPLLDGGYLYKPEFAPFGTDGKSWIIEGVGVEPDIYVDNDPAQEFAGTDQQLNKAIEVIMEELKTRGKDIPPIPPYPQR